MCVCVGATIATEKPPPFFRCHALIPEALLPLLFPQACTSVDPVVRSLLDTPIEVGGGISLTNLSSILYCQGNETLVQYIAGGMLGSGFLSFLCGCVLRREGGP